VSNRVNGHAKFQTSLVPAPKGTTWEEAQPYVWAAVRELGYKWVRLIEEVHEGVVTAPDGYTTYDLTDNNIFCFRVEYGK
jgi:hypothetical protein